MFRILKKKNLAPNIFLMDVEAPRIAKNALPGQFLIVRVDDEGERVPLTIWLPALYRSSSRSSAERPTGWHS